VGRLAPKFPSNRELPGGPSCLGRVKSGIYGSVGVVLDLDYATATMGSRPWSYTYQDFGLLSFYDLLLPHVRGSDRRLFFNRVSEGMAIYFGVLGALLGWVMLGPLGVILGFGGGIVFGANFLTKNRYHRP
jgi:hypothetical protein